MTNQWDVAVIGGGASGLAAACTAAAAGCRVGILERGARVGRKLLATGSGKCNLTYGGADAARVCASGCDSQENRRWRWGCDLR